MMKILTIAILLILSSVNLSFALEKQHNSEVKKQVISNMKSSATKQSTEEIADPDLKLSIEELKRKYPISLLDEKKKNYKEGQKINIDDYSEAEIKAAFLNADKNFVSRKKVEGRDVTISDGSIFWVDEEVLVKNQQELIIIGISCDKLRHSDWSKLNKKWKNLFDFIFSDDLPISYYYTIKYVPRDNAGFCLYSVEEARGL